jgi:hypothetical protein
MNRNQTSKRNRKGMVGNVILVIGSAVLVTYSAALTWQLHSALTRISPDSLGFFGSAGLASQHAMRIIVFDHAALISVLYRILVLSFALTLMLIGIALRPRMAARRTAPGRRDLRTSSEGDQ